MIAEFFIALAGIGLITGKVMRENAKTSHVRNTAASKEKVMRETIAYWTDPELEYRLVRQIQSPENRDAVWEMLVATKSYLERDTASVDTLHYFIADGIPPYVIHASLNADGDLKEFLEAIGSCPRTLIGSGLSALGSKYYLAQKQALRLIMYAHNKLTVEDVKDMLSKRYGYYVFAWGHVHQRYEHLQPHLENAFTKTSLLFRAPDAGNKFLD